MDEYYTHYITVTITDQEKSRTVIVAKFHAESADAAKVIARAMTKNWVSTTKSKHVGYGRITKDMVKLHTMPKKP